MGGLQAKVKSTTHRVQVLEKVELQARFNYEALFKVATRTRAEGASEEVVIGAEARSEAAKFEWEKSADKLGEE